MRPRSTMSAAGSLTAATTGPSRGHPRTPVRPELLASHRTLRAVVIFSRTAEDRVLRLPNALTKRQVDHDF